jgi:hypothetical protein
MDALIRQVWSRHQVTAERWDLNNIYWSLAFTIEFFIVACGTDGSLGQESQVHYIWWLSNNRSILFNKILLISTHKISMFWFWWFQFFCRSSWPNFENIHIKCCPQNIELWAEWEKQFLCQCMECCDLKTDVHSMGIEWMKY